MYANFTLAFAVVTKSKQTAHPCIESGNLSTTNDPLSFKYLKFLRTLRLLLLILKKSTNETLILGKSPAASTYDYEAKKLEK